MGSVFQAILTSVSPAILAKAVGGDGSREDAEGDIFEAVVDEVNPLFAAIDDPRYINPEFIHDLTLDDETFPHPVVFGAVNPDAFDFWLRKWSDAQLEAALEARNHLSFSDGIVTKIPQLSLDHVTRIWSDTKRVLKWPDGVRDLDPDLNEEDDYDVRSATRLAEGAYLWNAAFFSLVHRSSKLTLSDISGVLSERGKYALVLVQQHT